MHLLMSSAAMRPLFIVILTDEAESVGAGQVTVEGDDRDVFLGKDRLLLLNGWVVHGADSSALNARL